MSTFNVAFDFGVCKSCSGHASTYERLLKINSRHSSHVDATGICTAKHVAYKRRAIDRGTQTAGIRTRTARLHFQTRFSFGRSSFAIFAYR